MKSIIVDQRITAESENALLKLGFNVMKAPSLPTLPSAIASHPDTLFFRFQNTLFTYADYAEPALSLLSDLREYHRCIKFSFICESPGSVYPTDCHLNALLIGGKIYARQKSLSLSLIELSENEKIEIQNVKQGYPACSVLKLNEGSAITSDKGLAKSLIKNGIEVLVIKEGEIDLFPHKYGFIGGASFVFSDTVYFFGDIKKHSDGEKITQFIAQKGLKVISLGRGPLTDLGGAFVFEN